MAFASSCICMPEDRATEVIIGQRIPEPMRRTGARVACYTVPGEPPKYGLVFSWRGFNKTFERPTRFEHDPSFIENLISVTASGMENSRLPIGWVYEADEADEMPEHFHELGGLYE
jgi:hypothetical protein